MVLDECKRLVEDSSEKSQNKIEELNSEIRKLKAMIGKETRLSRHQTELTDGATTRDDHLQVALANINLMFVAVKHETRIRTLETKNKEQEKTLKSAGLMLNNNGHTEMDPDEV